MTLRNPESLRCVYLHYSFFFYHVYFLLIQYGIYSLQEAEEIMEDFLQKCKKICTEGVSEEDQKKSVEKLRTEVLAKDNAYIKTLLSQ